MQPEASGAPLYPLKISQLIKTYTMTNIIEWLKAKLEERRERRAAQALADIEDRFSVAERGGKLYILCGRTAVAVVEKSTTTDATIKAVKTMRAAATDYARQLPDCIEY